MYKVYKVYKVYKYMIDINNVAFHLIAMIIYLALLALDDNGRAGMMFLLILIIFVLIS